MYIIGKRLKKKYESGPNGLPVMGTTGPITLSEEPMPQTKETALKEAARLSRIAPDYEFCIFKLVVGVTTKEQPVEIKEY